MSDRRIRRIASLVALLLAVAVATALGAQDDLIPTDVVNIKTIIGTVAAVVLAIVLAAGKAVVSRIKRQSDAAEPLLAEVRSDRDETKKELAECMRRREEERVACSKDQAEQRQHRRASERELRADNDRLQEELRDLEHQLGKRKQHGGRLRGLLESTDMSETVAAIPDPSDVSATAEEIAQLRQETAGYRTNK